jgi:tetratricopeptide (TPR) repeat protein
MERMPLDVSPVAEFLIGLVERSETCVVELSDRNFSIVRGELQHVSAAPDDLSFAEFLLRSGRLKPEDLAPILAAVGGEGPAFEAAIRSGQRLRDSELRAQKRALWLDRLQRALRASLPLATPGVHARSLNPRDPAADGGGGRVKLVPLLLDALSRLALESDAALVGARLKHRLLWLKAALEPEARQWAGFGALSERSLIASLLAKLPACAPLIAALLRAGFARLLPPGRMPAPTTLPEWSLPPPADLLILPEEPPALEPRPLQPSAAESGPRLRLDPGAAGAPIDAIPLVTRVALPPRQAPLHDPFAAAEQALRGQLPAAERVPWLLELADQWETRIGSLEEAARHLREAVAADPNDPDLLARAARYCGRLGQAELAIRYAQAAIAAAQTAGDRADCQQQLAELHLARGDREAAMSALAEAAADHPDEAWPHEHLAQLLCERDNLPLAAAHARLAAGLQRVRDPQRALSLYALAYGWDPAHAELATEYADALEALGHAPAAIAVLAETARQSPDALRRSLRLQAVTRAERQGRPDLGADLLLEIFAEPEPCDDVHERLVSCLDRPGLEAEHAALLEALAERSPAALGGGLLLRCAEALARVPGQAETSLRYLWLAQRRNASVLSAHQGLQLSAATPQTLAGFQIEPSARAKVLETSLAGSLEAPRRHELLVQLSALRAELGDRRGSCSANLRLLALDENDALAAARLHLAASGLADPVLRTEALTALTRNRRGRDQARALAGLARAYESVPDFASALASAEAALADDPSAADAALIGLRHVQRVAPLEALRLLNQARKLLAAPPALLTVLAETAGAAGQRELQLEVLTEISLRLPFLLEPRLSALSAALSGDDPVSIVSRAEALLEHARGPLVCARARDAAARLAELGRSADAARLAERVLCAQARVDPEYADAACMYARAAGDSALLARALERAINVHSGTLRAECLFRLAGHHAAHADRTAELRALLRAAALPEGRSHALSLLQERFAAAGDLNRLLTVLALRLESNADPESRRRLLFEMASACVSLEDDRVRAATYMRALFFECETQRVWLLFALGGLFALGDPGWAIRCGRGIAHAVNPDVGAAIYLWLAHRAERDPALAELALDLAAEGASRFPAQGELLLLAERLTLSRADRGAALALYEELIAAAMGVHGRRALHYRAGRWLERSGALEQALTHYRRAFDLAKGAGVAFSALERVARAAHRLDTLVEAQLVLASLAGDDKQRAALLQTAIQISLVELKDAPRALRILIDAEASVPPGLLDDALREVARQLTAAERQHARPEIKRMAVTRAERVAQLWDGEAKAQSLLSLARLQLLAAEGLGPALASFDAVLGSELRNHVNGQRLAFALRDWADVLDQVGRAQEAQQARREAYNADPEDARAANQRSSRSSQAH